MIRRIVFATLVTFATSRAVAQQAKLAEPELIKSLGAFVDSLAKADRFSGVMLLAKADKAVFQQAWGLADREAGRPNTLETHFNLGSINKAFTATAIRQLAAEQKLALGDTLIRL